MGLHCSPALCGNTMFTLCTSICKFRKYLSKNVLRKQAALCTVSYRQVIFANIFFSTLKYVILSAHFADTRRSRMFIRNKRGQLKVGRSVDRVTADIDRVIGEASL